MKDTLRDLLKTRQGLRMEFLHYQHEIKETDKEIKNMGKEMRSLAAFSGQAMDKLTKARYDIVSAGFADAASSALFLKTSADLAVGGVTDIGVASDFLTTTLNAYNLEVGETVNVFDPNLP